MEATDNFKKVIENHLNSVAINDSVFAEKMKSKDKSIDNCINYIFKTVQDSGKNSFTDNEVFGMAVHYYDESNIGAVEAIKMKVVVNHSVELSEDEKAKAKQIAIDKEIQNQQAKLKAKPVTKKVDQSQQISLF
jgi:hypothetical protein